MEGSLLNLFLVSIVAFAVPLTLGFFPKLRLPSVVLEIVAGILLGPAVLGWVSIDGPVALMATLGVAFLLFLAGLELDVDALKGTPLRLGAAGFALSLVIALVGTVPLGYAGVILSPLLVAVALSSTSVGIVIPVLKDTGNLNTDVGKFTVAGGSAAEFGSIALLGVLFAANADTLVKKLSHALSASLVLVLFVVLITGALWLVGKVFRWEAGMRVTDRLDETSAQLRVRFAVMLLLGAAVLAAAFGFEAILGTFVVGIFVAALIKGDPKEERYRTRLEATGFGFFVPVFFIASGMRVNLQGVFTAEGVARVVVFAVLLLLARGLPALLFRRHVGTRGVIACGLMQATNLSFIVVATSVGLEIGYVRPITASTLVIAGLVSAILFPALAQSVLARETGA